MEREEDCMRNWKRRCKCALAVLVAAALVGSNADGLLLSAFAEESVYDADSQPAEAEDDSEELLSETSAAEPARGGIFLKDMEEALLSDEQQAEMREDSEDGQKEGTAENSEEDGRKEGAAENSEEGGRKEGNAGNSEEDSQKEGAAENLEEDGRKADEAEASEEDRKESTVKSSEDSRNEGTTEDGRQDSQAELSANAQEKEPAKTSVDSSADLQDETAASSKDKQGEAAKPSVDENEKGAETSSAGEQKSDTEALSENGTEIPEEPAQNPQIANPAEPAAENPQEDAAEAPEDEQTESPEAKSETVEITIVPEADIPDNDELFEGYVYQLFYGNDGISLYGNVGDRLTGDEEIIYDTLKAYIEKVASGEVTSTQKIPINGLSIYNSLTGTEEEIGAAVSEKTRHVLSYLLMDCPYDLYWFDKTKGMQTPYQYSVDAGSGQCVLRAMSVSFIVAEEYRSADAYTVDTTKVNAAKTAAETARNIVTRHSSESDYEKLKSYLNEICDLVSYNTQAASNTATPYGNPWQLVWVFDGDETTKVVCEGYSKAFQYLCDLSTFIGGVRCYTVTGLMGGGTGAGRHMWNIVTIGGKNYLVDVTNCDDNAVGRPDQLFLTGTSGSVTNGYTFNVNSTKVSYTYDASQEGLLGKVLELADTPYQEKKIFDVNIIEAPTATVTYGDKVEDQALTGGKAQIADGITAVDGTFSWAGVTSYGDAGSKVLKAVFTPSDTTQYQTVSNIDVPVTVNPKAITVTAQDAEKVYGTEDPGFSYTVTEGNVVNGDSLSIVYRRTEGENVREGGYAITPENPTTNSNSNYNITFKNGTLTINPAECVVSVSNDQNILQGTGKFTEPSFKGVTGETLTGQLTYSYGAQNEAVGYAALEAELANLSTGTTGEVKYSFKPDSANYNTYEGTFNFTIKDIEFTVNGASATVANALTVKDNAIYGDSWTDIISIGNITATAGKESDSTKGNFSLNVSGIPNAGEQSFTVVYNGTLGGKTYTNAVVCVGTVNVAKRTVTVTAGTYKVSKTYDKTTAAGAVTGSLDLGNILDKDKENVTVTADPAVYTDPNAGKQTSMTVEPVLSGTAAGNYTLGNSTVAVPCEITRKPITPDLEITGSYIYTGQPITPVLKVKDGTDELPASEYSATLANNVNAGTATVSVTSGDGGNYTWTAAKEGTFTINPANCIPEAAAVQDILEGVGEFLKPTFKGVSGEVLEGQNTYTYAEGSLTNAYYNTVKSALAKLPLDTQGTLICTFTHENTNYVSPCTTEINFTIKDIYFTVDGKPATDKNAVILKADAAYGDSWTELVAIANIMAKAGTESDSRPENFTLNVSGMPDAGKQNFEVLYSGSLGGKNFDKRVVCAGTIDVAARTITVSAGSYKVSKIYDKTVEAGTAAGELAVSGILDKDTGVTVTTVPAAYTNPDVGGQTQMVLTLTLNGDTVGNYKLGSNTVTVPCEILPMAITPELDITGTYSYTGQAIIPELTVSYTTGDGATETLENADYEIILSDNVNAGTAKVSVTPKAGGNYTWPNAVEGTFAIAKIDYPYAAAAELSARYGNDATFDLASLLPSGYVLGTVSAADSDGILEGVPAVNGSVLSCKMSSDRAKIGKTAVITVPVTESTNYNAFELALTVTLSDKLEQTDFRFSQAVISRTYGDSDFTAEVVNAAEGSTLSFTSSNPNVAIVDNSGKVQILGAGTTVITAWASETNDYMRGTAVCTLNVASRALAWDTSALSAADKEGAITNRKASLYGELRVTGILDADKGAVSFNCPADRLAGTYAAVEPGVQKVLLSWADAAKPAVLQGVKAANYVLPAALPEVTGKINAVSTVPVPPAESTAQVQFSLSMESGISQVPAALKGIESLNTPEKIEAQMKLNIQKQAAAVSEESTEVYDVTLMVNVNGAGWQAAGRDNFPADGLTVTLPYPEGTGKDANDFVVCHLFTEDMNGHKAGDVEYPAVTKTDEGIRFKVYGLSPISIGWTKAGELNNAVEVKQGGTASEPAGGQQSAAPESPKTSDENPMALYLIAMLISGGILAGMAFGRRRRNSRRK